MYQITMNATMSVAMAGMVMVRFWLLKVKIIPTNIPNMENNNRPDEYKEANDRITEMNSLSECMDFLGKKGFTEQFKIEDEAMISLSDNKRYSPEDVTAMNFYRFEGLTDPEDMSILYAIETVDGKKGTLTDSYGTYSDPDVNEFVKQMEIHKKVFKR
jgi:hypothetical protein